MGESRTSPHPSGGGREGDGVCATSHHSTPSPPNPPLEGEGYILIAPRRDSRTPHFSSPFKGEAGRGMGFAQRLATQHHPRPTLPLKGRAISWLLPDAV